MEKATILIPSSHQEGAPIKIEKNDAEKLILQKSGPNRQRTDALAGKYLSIGVQYDREGPKIPPGVRRGISKKSRCRGFTLPRMQALFRTLMDRAEVVYKDDGLAIDSFNKIVPFKSHVFYPSFLKLSDEAPGRTKEKYQVDQELKEAYNYIFRHLPRPQKISHLAAIARTFDPAGLGLDTIFKAWRKLEYYPYSLYVTQMELFFTELDRHIKSRWMRFATTAFGVDSFPRDRKNEYTEIIVMTSKSLVVLFRSLYIKLLMECFGKFIQNIHQCKLTVQACVTKSSRPLDSTISILPRSATITREFDDAILKTWFRVAIVPVWQILPASYVKELPPLFLPQMNFNGLAINKTIRDSVKKLHNDLSQPICAIHEELQEIYFGLSRGFNSISSCKDVLNLMHEEEGSLVEILNTAMLGQQLTYPSFVKHKNFLIDIQSIKQLWEPHISDLANKIINLCKRAIIARITTYVAEIHKLMTEIDEPICDGIHLMEKSNWVVQVEQGPLRKITRFSRKICSILLYLSGWSKGFQSAIGLSQLCANLQKSLKDTSNKLLSDKFIYEGNYSAELIRLGVMVKEFFAQRINGYWLFSSLENIELNDYYLKDTFQDLQSIENQTEFTIKNLDALRFKYEEGTDLHDLKESLLPMAKLAGEALKWQLLRANIMFGPRELVDGEAFERELDNTVGKFLTYNEMYKKRHRRLNQQQSFYAFGGIIDSPIERLNPGPMKLIKEVQASLSEMKEFCPLIKIITNPHLKTRHWVAIENITNIDFDDKGLSLFELLKKGIIEFQKELDPISTAATGEAALEMTLDDMIREWKNVKFNLIYSPKLQINVLGSFEEIRVVLDEHLGKTLEIIGSTFLKPHKDRVLTWFNTLSSIENLLKDWEKAKFKWIYFFPIFASPDIKEQMPEEWSIYQDVSATYLKILGIVKKNPSVLELSEMTFVQNGVANNLKLLEKITTGVNAYLEQKRLFFGRFFFINNNDMLEILSETKEPTNVQKHIFKLFEGILKLSFDKKRRVWAMNSAENEEVLMYKRVDTSEAEGCVEKWLVSVEQMMVLSIKAYIMYGNKEYSIRRRNKWIQMYPGQVVLLVTQIHWTLQIGKCFNTYNPSRVLEKFLKCLQIQLNKVVELVRGELPAIKRITLNSLIVLDVHSRDTTKMLCERKITKAADFLWLSQLRYYAETDVCKHRKVKKPINESNVFVCMMTAKVNYQFEYLGIKNRVVMTPLTERCYRILIGAFSLHLNGALEGPAGTGKTETIKDLAKSIAVRCIVFNCSDGLDYLEMQKLFKGLASCGAWACLDEFNRIKTEVLSVIAQQILSIIQAVWLKREQFDFEGTEISLNPACYVCITMNPKCVGRSDLPDNLKVLFRTVAMMVPDYGLIGEISLYSYGFVDAGPLSKKIVTIYELCSEQLSSQTHYDYGMVAVKTVLSTARNFKLRFSEESEESLILRAINEINLPKFLNYDVPLFEGIIRDLFPSTEISLLAYDELLNCTKKVCQTQNLEPVEAFLNKIVQTYEMILSRHGFIIVGDPLSGKFTLLKVLAEALSLKFQLYEKGAVTKYQTINPKSVTMGQLYGQFDSVSREWSDGIIPTVFRYFAQETTNDRKWVIFDGPIDPLWIENLNSVLDDNKKLCLNLGETIQITPLMTTIFVVMDLEQASPATVSRCGMIYMEAATLGWKPFVESWNKTIPNDWHYGDNERFIKYFDWLIPPCLEYTKTYGLRLTNAGDIRMVMTVCDIFFGIFQGALNHPEQKDIKDIEHYSTWVQAAMMTAVFWGIGGTLDTPSRLNFDEFYKQLWTEHEDWPPEFEEITVNIPPDGLIENNTFQYVGAGSWLNYESVLQNYENKNAGSTNVVPTVETLKIGNIMKVLVSSKKPFLLVGPTCTGKSTIINDLLLHEIDQEIFMPSVLTFTATVSCSKIQELVMSNLIRKRKGLFAPNSNKVDIVFCDDINMPEKLFGVQPPLELIRAFLKHGNWHDLNSLDPIVLENLYIIAAMGLPGGIRQDVYGRFLRHFSLFAFNSLQDESIVKIFSEILISNYKKRGVSTIYVQDIVEATLTMFQWSLKNVLPTPKQCHYIFNIYDIKRVIQGLSLLRKESMFEKENFIRIWTHENIRVFHDRLVKESDREMFLLALKDTVKDKFKENFDVMLEGITNDEENKEVQTQHLDNLLFTSSLNTSDEDRLYEEVLSYNDLFISLNNALDDYNRGSMDKVEELLFRFAVLHLIRICRIISIPGDHGLLLGISGCGKRSLVRIATHIYNMPLFEPRITLHYGIEEWYDDIKSVLKYTGIDNLPHGFMFGDSQASEEFSLQDIDILLNTGGVPNIFRLEETAEIIESVRDAAQGGDRELNYPRYRLYSFFQDRCKMNLHILLCYSPLGDNLRRILRIYPSIVKCCTMNWLGDWPEEAIEIVAQHYLTKANIADNLKDSVVKAFKHFNFTAKDAKTRYLVETGRKVFYTCKALVDIANSFAITYDKKSSEVMGTVRRYKTGQEKYEFAKAQVMTMEQDLNHLMSAITENDQKVINLTTQIPIEETKVTAAVARFAEDEQEVQKQAIVAEFCKTDCKRERSLLPPITSAAFKALSKLQRQDIDVLKRTGRPPMPVLLVMSAICVMLGVKPDRIPDPDKPGRMMDDYWGPSKQILNDMNFIDKLKTFHVENIPPERIDIIRGKYLSDPQFKPEIVGKTSPAAQGLCKWIIAMDQYAIVMKAVAPKLAKLTQAEEDLRTLEQGLLEKQKLLQALKTNLENLQAAKNEATAKDEELKKELDLCKAKFNKGTLIVDSLGGEQIHWKLLQEEYQKKLDTLPGDVLISCGIITYLGPLPANMRAELRDNWLSVTRALNIPTSENYSFSGTFGSEVIILDWVSNGLPNDPFSVDNALIADNPFKFSLMIDAESLAKNWVLNTYSGNINVIRLSQNYMPIVESCIQKGGVLLLEDIGETIDPTLDPLIKQHFFYEGSKKFVIIGDSVLFIHDDFKFFITTKLVNPRFVPDIYNDLTVVNFTLAIDGLTDLLVSKIISIKEPELENLRMNYITESALNKAQLKVCEEEILECLQREDFFTYSNTTSVLDRFKITSESEIEANKTKNKIDSLKTAIRPVSNRCSHLYYIIVKLPKVNPMYQFSLDWFITIVENVIRTILKSNEHELEQFIKRLSDDFYLTIYQNIITSLFNRDRALFSFIFAVTILEAGGLDLSKELSFLLTGGVALKNTPSTDYMYSTEWLPESAWKEICRVHSVPSFKEFQRHFEQHIDEWYNFYSLSSPTFSDIPIPWSQSLTIFEQLLIFRMLRPDRLKSCIEEFIKNLLGDKYTIPKFNMEKTIRSCPPFTPIIFISSPGADPMGSLCTLFEKMHASVVTISLGQGQGPVAETIIRNKLLPYTLICLQNCHLLNSWMPELEALCEELPNMKEEHQIPGFHLFLTSLPSKNFPVTILQKGIKIINEPPVGLMNNLLQCYHSVSDQSFYNSIQDKDFMFHRLLLGISFFHAVIIERQAFGRIGWNVPYGFNNSDYQISVTQLQKFLQNHQTSPYDAVLYVTAILDCNYGGRVTDDWDRKTLNMLIKCFVSTDIVHENSYSLCPGDAAFRVPKLMSHDSVVSFIKSLPAETPTAVIGLHPNAGIVREILDMHKLQNGLLKMMYLGSEQNFKEENLLLNRITEILDSKHTTRVSFQEDGTHIFSTEHLSDDLENRPFHELCHPNFMRNPDVS